MPSPSFRSDRAQRFSPAPLTLIPPLPSKKATTRCGKPNQTEAVGFLVVLVGLNRGGSCFVRCPLRLAFVRSADIGACCARLLACLLAMPGFGRTGAKAWAWGGERAVDEREGVRVDWRDGLRV